MVGVIPNHLVRVSRSSTMQVAVGLLNRACSWQSAQGMGVDIIRFVVSIREVLSGPRHAQNIMYLSYILSHLAN